MSKKNFKAVGDDGDHKSFYTPAEMEYLNIIAKINSDNASFSQRVAKRVAELEKAYGLDKLTPIDEQISWLNKWQKDLEAMAKELLDKNQKLVDVQLELTKTREELKQYKAQVDSYDEALRQSQQKLSFLEANFIAHQTSENELLSSLKNYQQQVTIFESEYQTITHLLKSKEAELEKRNQAEQQAQMKLLEQQKTLTNMSQQLDTLQKQFAFQDQVNVLLNEEQAALAQENQTLHKRNEALTQTIEQLRQSQQQFAKEKLTLEQRLHQLSNNLQQLPDTLQKEQQQLQNQLEEEQTQLTTQNIISEDKKNELATRRDTLSQCNTLLGKMQGIIKNLFNKKQEADQLAKRLQKLQEEIAKEQKDLLTLTEFENIHRRRINTNQAVEMATINETRYDLEILLRVIARLVTRFQLPHPSPNVYFSYAWPTEIDKRYQLQTWLKRLKDDLILSGISQVFFDLDDMAGGEAPLTDKMEGKILLSQFALLACTPDLKKRAESIAHDGKKNNLQHELEKIKDHSTLSQLIVIFEGDFTTALPTSPKLAERFVYYAGDDNSYQNMRKYLDLLLALSNPKGLIPILLSIDAASNKEQSKDFHAVYQELIKNFLKAHRLENDSDEAKKTAPAFSSGQPLIFQVNQTSTIANDTQQLISNQSIT